MYNNFVMRYSYIIILSLALLIASFVAIGAKFTLKTSPEQPSAALLDNFRKQLNEIKNEQVVIKAKLSTLEQSLRSSQISKPSVASQPKTIEDNYITETITPANIDEKASWNMTNKAGIYIITIPLQSEPITDTVQIQTSMGLLPPDAHRLEGTTISILSQEPKENFVTSDDFIAIRYKPRS